MIGLHEDVLEMFARYEGVFDFETETEGLPWGYHADRRLTTTRETTGARVSRFTEEERKDRRRASTAASTRRYRAKKAEAK